MDIDAFYDEDSRRRSSSELEFGTEWRDAQGVRFELSWVEDTGELYVMREPVPEGWATPFGGVHVRHAHSLDEDEVEGMTVTVLGTISSRADVESILAGWQEAMGAPDGVAWLVDTLRRAGVVAGATAPPGTA